MERIVIDITADPSKLQPLLDKLNEIGATDKKNTENFKKNSREHQSAMKESEGIAGKLGEQFKELGTKIVAAFAIEKILEFGSESVKAFSEAELAAKKLSFALEKIVGGTKSQLKEIVEQSEKLSKTTYFSPKQVQQSQAMQAQLGLNAEQIKKLTPLIADLAAAQGTDFASATDTALRAIEGQTRGLRTVGAEFKTTGSKVGDYNMLLEKLSKLQGTATNAMDTTYGSLKNQEKEVEILQEKVGEKLAHAWLNVKSAVLETGKALYDVASGEAFHPKEKQTALGLLKEQYGELNLKEINEKLEGLNKQLEKTKGYFVTATDTKLTESFNTNIYDQIKVLEELRKEKEEAENDPKLIQLKKYQNEKLLGLSKDQLKKEIELLGLRSDASTIDVQTEIDRREKQVKNLEKLQEESFKKAQENSQKLVELRIESEKKAEAAKVETDPIAKLDAEYDASLQNAVRLFNLTNKSTKDREELARTLAAIEIEFENKVSDETERINQERNKKIIEDNKKAAEEKFREEMATLDLIESEKLLANEKAFTKEKDQSEKAAFKKRERDRQIRIATLEEKKKWDEDDKVKQIELEKEINKIKTEGEADRLKFDEEQKKKELENIKDFSNKAIDAYNLVIENRIKAIDEQVKVEDDAIKTQADLAARGQKNTLAFEEKRKAELERARMSELEKQRKAKELEAFLNAFIEFSKAPNDPTQALPKALALIAVMKGAEAQFMEEGGIVGKGKPANGRRHKSGRDMLVHAEQGEGILSTAEIRNLGGESAFLKLKESLSLPLTQRAMPVAAVISNTMTYGKEIVSELQSLKDAVLSKKETSIDFDGLHNMVVTSVQSGIRNVTKYINPKPLI